MVHVSRVAVLLTLVALVPPTFGADLADDPASSTPATPTVGETPVATPAPGPAAPTAGETPLSTAHRDGRRTTSRFLSNLGRNSVGMFSKDNLVPFAVGTGVGLLAVPFDDNVQRYFGGGERKAQWLGDFADWLGKPIVLTPIAAALYGIGRMAPNHHRLHEATYDIAQVFLINAAYTTAIKYPAHRLRPDESNYLSFPSGHTSNAFAWATVANHYYGPKLGIPAFAFASLIGVGRMEKNVHWLSDVVGGAAVGCLVARTVVRRDHEELPARHAYQFRIAPLADSRGSGMGLAATLQF